MSKSRSGIGGVCLAAVLCLPMAGRGAEIEVASADAARTALTKVAAGDIVTLADGDYPLGGVVIQAQGTAEKPIVIRAKRQNRAILTGRTWFAFQQAAHVTLQGLTFETLDVGPVQILGSHHIRVTRCIFRVDEKPKEPGALIRWIHIDGGKAQGSQDRTIPSHHNRIDHNLLEGKRVRGQMIAIDGVNTPTWAASQHDRIDHNHFRMVGPRIPNGMEPIRAGLAETSISSGFTVIEDNLFEQCDGDSEVISLKHSDSIVRSNTVVNCQGGIFLRHGNRNEVYGNAVFGQNKPGSTGVLLWGDDHKVHDNYFQDLDQSGIALQNGDVDYPAEIDAARDKGILVAHVRARRISIRNNTLVNCAHPFVFGGTEPRWDFKLPAQDVTVADNLVLGGRNPLVTMINELERLTWKGNVMWRGPDTKLGVEATPEQIRMEEPVVPPVTWLTGADVGPLSGGD